MGTSYRQTLRAQCSVLTIAADDQRCSISASKSMGLYRNEDWEWAQAATKSCGRDVRLPTADDHQYCSTPTKERLCLIGASPVAKQVERHHFFACRSLRDNHVLFNIFDIFDFSILGPPAGHLSTSTHSFDIQTYFVAR